MLVFLDVNFKLQLHFQGSIIRYPAQLVLNYVSQLNLPLKCSCSSVTSEKKWAPDKSCSDIAVLIFLFSFFLPSYKLCESLLEPTLSFCTATIKITRQWDIPLEGGGGRFWNHFQLCPSSKALFLCNVLHTTPGLLLFLQEINPKTVFFDISFGVSLWYKIIC